MVFEKISNKTGIKTQSALGNYFGVTQGAVRKWMAKGAIPLSRIQQISALTGIPRHELAPELYEGYVLAEKKQASDMEASHEQEASE